MEHHHSLCFFFMSLSVLLRFIRLSLVPVQRNISLVACSTTSRVLVLGNTILFALWTQSNSRKGAWYQGVQSQSTLPTTGPLSGVRSKEKQSVLETPLVKSAFLLSSLSFLQVDAIVSSVNRMGVFADVGPLPVFVSNHVCSP